MLYNVYCDETCHLEHDGINDMVIGAVWCPQNKLREINQRIKEIKARNGISPSTELKWTKVSPAKVQAYKDVIDYFFDDDDLHFRAIIIPDKSKINHAAFHQTHDEWYYKMYFENTTVIRTLLGWTQWCFSYFLCTFIAFAFCPRESFSGHGSKKR